MCISTNNQSEYIRRRSQKDMVMRSNCASDYDSNKVPNAAICAPGVSATSVEGESRGFFRSSTARLVLTIASVALLLSSLIGMGSTNGAANLKDLSDRVMDLTRQLQNLGLGGGRPNEEEESERDLLGLQKQLEDAEIELAWEKQHVDDQKERQRAMHDVMVDQIKRDQVILKGQDEKIAVEKMRNAQVKTQLQMDESENIKLKRDLTIALDQLASARAELPAAPLGPGSGGETDDKNGLSGTELKKLRGVPAREYQPGDNIEIIEYRDGGNIALCPGIVSDVNPDGTYDLVKLEQSVVIKGYRREHFQTYHAYDTGMPALFQEQRDVFEPITIVRLLPGSFPPGFEIHGSYQYTLDRDKSKIIREGRAMRMHRYAGTGEIIGEGSRADMHE